MHGPAWNAHAELRVEELLLERRLVHVLGEWLHEQQRAEAHQENARRVQVVDARGDVVTPLRPRVGLIAMIYTHNDEARAMSVSPERAVEAAQWRKVRSW